LEPDSQNAEGDDDTLQKTLEAWPLWEHMQFLSNKKSRKYDKQVLAQLFTLLTYYDLINSFDY